MVCYLWVSKIKQKHIITIGIYHILGVSAEKNVDAPRS